MDASNGCAEYTLATASAAVSEKRKIIRGESTGVAGADGPASPRLEVVEIIVWPSGFYLKLDWPYH